MKVAIGVFDGVHRGHQKVIEKAHRVITFDPHPHPIPLLTTVSERQDLIGNLDIIAFTKQLQSLSPEQFIEKHIIKPYAPEAIIVGHDFIFGNNRSGNVTTLRALGEKYNFTVEEVPEYCHKGQPVRSSTIREALQKADLQTARELLGRDYQINGTVIHGKHLGRKLGFPTINLKLEDKHKLIPAPGVYAGEVIIINKIYTAAIFIGKNIVEAHILNFDHMVYGKPCTLFFREYIRPIQKFDDVHLLTVQIQKDVQQISRI